MTKMLIATLALPLVIVAGTPAFAGGTYQGGPKSGLWTNATLTVETNKPYAQIVQPSQNRHIYRGGPNGTMIHGR